MMDLFQQAILPANLPYTILLALVMLYWLTVFVGVLDLDFLDLDLEMDADMDVDVDADIDTDSDVETGGDMGWFAASLGFFNIGMVPFMIFLSFLVLSMWAISILANAYWGGSIAWLPAMILIPNLLISLLLTKALTTPFKGAHKKMNEQGVAKRELVGKMCNITVGVSPGQKGQAELTYNEQHFLLSIRTQEDTLKKGEQALIIEYDPAQNYFWVTPFSI